MQTPTAQSALVSRLAAVGKVVKDCDEVRTRPMPCSDLMCSSVCRSTWSSQSADWSENSTARYSWLSWLTPFVAICVARLVGQVGVCTFVGAASPSHADQAAGVSVCWNRRLARCPDISAHPMCELAAFSHTDITWVTLPWPFCCRR